jgi:hypothetical protein
VATPLGYGAIVLLLSLPRLFIAGQLELLSDEAYYALWSMYPSLGYFDHSPGIAWIIAAGRAVFGEGALSIRVVTNLLEFRDARGAVSARHPAVPRRADRSFGRVLLRRIGCRCDQLHHSHPGRPLDQHMIA